ncbi:MAG: hypothetical protein HC821_05680 [Lewinella sp.]|nr:hypothetical protein [Lewinella sp.]
MKDSKLVKQISLMDGRERERLRQFVVSPYFNQHRPSAKLLDLLLANLEAKKPLLDKLSIAKKLFPGQAFQEQPLADVMSSLMKLINRFLAIEQLEQRPLTTEVLTLERAQQTNRFELLKNRSKRLQRLLADYPHQGSEYHWASYRLYTAYGYYRNGYEDRSDAAPLQQMLHSLDRYYFVEKLRHACHLTANTMLMNTSFEFSLLEEVINHLQSPAGTSILANDHSINCYFHILFSLREPDDLSHYERLRYYSNEAFDLLPAEEQKDLFAFASNYCITRIMHGDNDFRRELFELYRRALATGLSYDNGIISEWNYKNIVTLGCAVEEYTWTEAFIEENYLRLPDKKRDNAYALNKAQYYYSRGLYHEAGDLLRKVADSDVKYHLARVLLEVRIAYDQQETNYLLNLLDTFRLYVRRQKKMSAKDKRSYLNYTRFARQLANLRHQETFLRRSEFSAKLLGLHQKIRETPSLVAGSGCCKKAS